MHQRQNSDERWRAFGYYSMKINFTDWLHLSAKYAFDYYRTRVQSTNAGDGINGEANTSMITNDSMDQMCIRDRNDTVLRGRKRSAYWAYRQDLYFYAVFSKPFTYPLYTDTVQENDKQIPVCKMLLHFETAKDEQVLAKFSISSVDAAGAYKNLQAPYFPEKYTDALPHACLLYTS